MKTTTVKELSKEGNLKLLTAYIMGLTGLQEDFAEEIAYESYNSVDEVIFNVSSKYREVEEQN